MGALKIIPGLLAVLLMFALYSCIDEINLKYRTAIDQLVIDGLIKDEDSSFIKLSYSGNFESSVRLPPELFVTNAQVTVADDRGTEVEFQHVEPGVYRPVDSAFRGIAGRSYTLKIQLAEGKTYVSKPELLSPVAPIDTIYGLFTDIQNSYKPDGYEIYINTSDPADATNFYRWSAYSVKRRKSTGVPSFGSVCCDYCWIYEFNNDVVIQDDALFNGKVIANFPVLFSPAYEVGDHYIEVAQYSLTRDAYQFWKLFREQRSRTGSIFDPAPSSIEGNVYNSQNPDEIALGFFGASSVKRKRTIISEFIDPFSLQQYNSRFVQEGDCRLAYPFSSFSSPQNW